MTPFHQAQQKAAAIPLMYSREAKKRVASEVLAELLAVLNKDKK